MKEFKDMNDSELYWFAVHFLNGADYNNDEDAERWNNFLDEVDNRSEYLQEEVKHLMDVL